MNGVHVRCENPLCPVCAGRTPREPFIRENAGSWAENGLWGQNADYVFHAYLTASDANRYPDQITAGPDTFLWLKGTIDRLGVSLVGSDLRLWDATVNFDSSVPLGTVRFFRNGRLLAEVRGFTP